MTPEDLERALRAHKELDAERDRRVDERFQAFDKAMGLQLVEMRRRLRKVEEDLAKLTALALGAPVVTAIIVYLLTRSGG